MQRELFPLQWQSADHLKLMFPMFTTVINIAWACLDDDAALKGSKYDGRSNWHWAVAKMLYGVRYEAQVMTCH